MATRVIAVMNQKGGVGKTTLTVNLGAALASLGKEVLLFDLDPQANLSIHLDVSIHELDRSVYDVLAGEKSIEDTALHHLRPGLSLVPANIDLSGAEVELVHAVGRETLLRDALEPYLAARSVDFVFFDCPPSLGILSLNALAAAQEVFIPIQTEFFALQGLSQLMGVIELIARRLNRNLRLSRVIPTMYDTRTSLSKEVLDDIQSHFGDTVTTTVIRKNVRLAEAPSHGRTILEYASSATGSHDFMDLARELLGEPVSEAFQEAAAAPPEPAAEPKKQAEPAPPSVPDVASLSVPEAAPEEPPARRQCVFCRRSARHEPPRLFPNGVRSVRPAGQVRMRKRNLRLRRRSRSRPAPQRQHTYSYA